MYALGLIGGSTLRAYKIRRYGEEANDPAIKRQTRIIACTLALGLGIVIPVLLHQQKDGLFYFVVTDFLRFAIFIWGFCSGDDGRLLLPLPPWRLLDPRYLSGERS